MSGPYNFLTGCPPGLFTGYKLDDTNSGLTTVTPPGSLDIDNGPIPGYVISIPGRYFFHAQVSFFANVGEPFAISAQVSIIMVRDGSLLRRVAACNSGFMVGNSINDISLYTNFTVEASTYQLMEVGDMVFVHVLDLFPDTGPSSYIKVNLADPENSFFEGYKV
jgi:hypothetical protein